LLNVKLVGASRNQEIKGQNYCIQAGILVTTTVLIRVKALTLEMKRLRTFQHSLSLNPLLLQGIPEDFISKLQWRNQKFFSRGEEGCLRQEFFGVRGFNKFN
jgi:hypothetical protein